MSWLVLTIICAAVPALAQVGVLCEAQKVIAPGGVNERALGAAVAVDGEWAFAGTLDSDCSPGAVFVSRFDSGEWLDAGKLTPPEAAFPIGFGRSVSVAGDVVLVGAPDDGDALPLSGSVYVLRYHAMSDEWLQETKLTASDGAMGDSFGFSVSIAGDVALVGSPGSDCAGTQAGCAYVFRFDAATGEWLEQGKLIASDPVEWAQLGRSVSLSGDVALLGAHGDDEEGSSAGAAYVFRHDASSGEWFEDGKLTASDAAPLDWFGYSVSVSGDVALVGAFRNDDAGTSSGAAYAYRYDAVTGEWTLETKLVAADAGGGDEFGASVSVSGGMAIVGAFSEDGAAANAGSVYVFGFDGGSWIEQQKLTASDAFSSDYFGWSVFLGGDVALVGATGDDSYGSHSDSGSAYIFNLDLAGSWVEQGRLSSSGAAAGDAFGRAVMISGEVALIGVPDDDDAGPDSGSAYVYRADPLSGEWFSDGRLAASDAGWWHSFGFAVDVSGDFALLGAPGVDDAGQASGAAYLFGYDPGIGEWLEEAKFTAVDGAENDMFGRAVGISGGTVFVGAPGQDDAGDGAGLVYVLGYNPVSDSWQDEMPLLASDASQWAGFGGSLSLAEDLAIVGASGDGDQGAAYVYRFDPVSESWLEEAKLTASDGAVGDRFGSAVSLSGEVAIVGAMRHDDAGPNSGSAYVYRYDSASGTWFEEAKLTAADAVAFDLFGGSVSIFGDRAIVGTAGDGSAGVRSGSAYVFGYDAVSGSWLGQGRLVASDGRASDAFGGAVSVSGNIALVGAVGDDDACLPFVCSCQSGAVYFFDIEESFDGLEFIRGDANGDGDVDLADAVYGLQYLFTGGSAVCLDAVDTNDDGTIDVGDAVFALGYAFVGGEPPPCPWSACGFDPTLDTLGCGMYGACP